MVKKTLKIIFITLVSLLLASPNFAQQQQDVEEITVTSYYPAPFASYDKLTIDNKLGIGTANPADLLHLYSTADDTRSVIIDAKGTSSSQQASLEFLSLGDGSKTLGVAGTKGWSIFTRGNAWSTTAEQNDLGLSYWDGSAWTNALSIDSATGNVGVGTMSPATKLHIKGTDNPQVGLPLTGRHAVVVDVTGSGNAFYYLARDGIGKAYMALGTDNDLYFGIDDGTAQNYNKMIISTSGNIGMGTSTPTAKLDVRGDIKLNSDGSLFAPGGVENLRVIRGNINADGTVAAGSGFSVNKTATGTYVVTFSTAFPSAPTVVATHAGLDGGFAVLRSHPSTTSVEIQVRSYSAHGLIDGPVCFIATGPR